MNILVVDDDKAAGEGLSCLLSKEGYSVDLAENGEIAFEKLTHRCYNLVVTDLMMPMMDGLRLLSRIKSTGNDCPVIVITAYANIENLISVYELGGVDVLEKPFEVQQLLDIIKRVMFL